MTVLEAKIKTIFTKTEINKIKEAQKEPLRFQIEDETKKARFNVYRIRPEEGIDFCNAKCNQIFEGYEGMLYLRIFSRVSNTAYEEIAYAERTKDTYFDAYLFSE